MNELLYAAMALQVLDVATTYYALTKIAGTYEVNGIMAKAMAKLGLVPTLAIKLAIAAGVLWYARDQVIVLGGACVIYLLIVGNNIKVIRSNR